MTSSEDRILTIPNLVTFVRLAGVAAFWWVLIVRDDVVAAAWLILAIGWTDWIDGYLARKLDQVTKLGKVLDPVADRLMIGSAVIGGLVADVIPAAIAIPLLLREVVMAVVAARLAATGGGVLAVRYWGKLATFLLYGAIPAFYLSAAGVATWFMTPSAWIFGAIGLILYWGVLFQYVGDARSRQLESSHPER